MMIRLCQRVALACLLYGYAVAMAAPTEIKNVRVAPSSQGARVVFDLTHPASYKIFTLSKPDRLVIDFIQTQLAARLPALDNPTLFTALRSGPRGEGNWRVVFDLKHPLAKYQALLLAPAPGYDHRLVVDVMGTVAAPPILPESSPSPPPMDAKPLDNPRVVATTLTPIVPTPNNPVSPERTPTILPPVASSTSPRLTLATAEPTLSSPAASTALPQDTPLRTPGREIVVAIDAGHGGADPGAIGPGGVYEKDLTLAIAKKLAALVRKEPGMTPVLIRDDDEFIELRKRTHKARAQHADIFISIHADAAPDPRARGASVFILSERGASSEAARWLAEKENAADLLGGAKLDTKDKTLASVLLDLSQTAAVEASHDVAAKVLEGLDRIGETHRDHVEHAAFVVLKSPDIPSLLVETAFLSNPTEAKKLQDPVHQEKLAAAILAGVRDYFSKNPPLGTQLAARPAPSHANHSKKADHGT